MADFEIELTSCWCVFCGWQGDNTELIEENEETYCPECGDEHINEKKD